MPSRPRAQRAAVLAASALLACAHAGGDASAPGAEDPPSGPVFVLVVDPAPPDNVVTTALEEVAPRRGWRVSYSAAQLLVYPTLLALAGLLYVSFPVGLFGVGLLVIVAAARVMGGPDQRPPPIAEDRDSWIEPAALERAAAATEDVRAALRSGALGNRRARDAGLTERAAGCEGLPAVRGDGFVSPPYCAVLRLTADTVGLERHSQGRWYRVYVEAHGRFVGPEGALGERTVRVDGPWRPLERLAEDDGAELRSGAVEAAAEAGALLAGEISRSEAEPPSWPP